MRFLTTFAACLCLGAFHVQAKSTAGDRVVVFVPKLDAASEYSQFLDSLGTRGFDVSFEGDRLYDHAIVLSPSSKKFGSGISVSDFLSFVDSGGNLIVAASHELSDIHRKLALQFGVTFEKRGSRVVDHTSHLAATVNQSDHSVVAAKQFAQVDAVLSKKVVGGKPVLFKGIAHAYDAANPLLVPLLTGARTTYSAASSAARSDVVLTGMSIGLVSAFQTRSNARVVFSGSADLFSNRLLGQKAAGNTQFVKEISQWAFQEKSVLRSTAHRHHFAATGETPEHYRVNNEIVYEVDLSVYYDDAWHPYVASDVQFEAIMLDPYIRATLNRTESNAAHATYHGDIKLPDRYGTFTFRVNYKRTGYSNVVVQDTVGIWPLRHDEYPRFLSAAYPYYVGSLTMVLGFLALSAAWLWNTEPKKAKSKTN
ncbi:Dolichyl-diphosphooligosaccharide-protein glycosyltransferase 48kDa subunit [Linderina pennispora]|uniref:Dolichyl-diphosphooligosaccharide--protein glycosyltransferase subunit WBP1 n=1 Tax=Linderina pennispora TaxID=61395 RepID=A0A1Y1WIP3_9FUNG|nr:Dolichyl-diphosphooligosaccharide-protein glycosyltransferase 48kDa subunit [Linderina pennispora]ORX73198.1 Dolichyl-diphosphooligosaccharide-protein glycosyltransferase 48kDa subunit [Linderina pennispora]